MRALISSACPIAASSALRLFDVTLPLCAGALDELDELDVIGLASRSSCSLAKFKPCSAARR